MSKFDRVGLERESHGNTRRSAQTDGAPHARPGSRLGQFRFAPLLPAVLLSALILPLAFATQASAEEFQGYVKSVALNVRKAPGATSDIAGILLKYDPVTVTGERNVGSTRWFSIKASGGYVEGWVAARFIERGEAPESTAEAEIDYGARETPTLMRGDFKYVGVRVCAECHDDSTGDYEKGAVPVWQSHFHSQAMKSLKRDYTKTIASRTRDIEDPATDWRCVKCHQTAYGAPPEQIADTYRAEDGVGCEVCHGPGSVYAEEDHGPEVENREAMGFRVLRDLSDRRKVCTSCHNKASPTFIGFDLREFSRKIAHWVDKDDAAYYAEYDKEAARRASTVEKPTKKAAGAGVIAGAAGTAGAAGAAGAKSAADAGAEASSAAAEAAEAARAAQAASDAEAARAAEAAAREKARAAAARDEAQEKAAQEKAAREQEAARKRAEAEAEARRKEEAARAAAAAEAARKKEMAEAAAKPAAKPAADPLAHYLADVDDVIVMNTNGKKYKKAKFNHKKHATGAYLDEMTCQTCHHTQEGDESPESCNSCHDIGGDADEDKAKKRYVHTKKMAWPKEPDQEQISCISCHNVMNDLLASGDREGKKAPVKCTQCHARNKD